MGFVDDLIYRVKNLGEGIASGEVFRDLSDIVSWAGKSFVTDVLEIGVDEKIDGDVARRELANQIKTNLANGNYNTVNIGLTAEVSGIQRRSQKTVVDFSVCCDDSDETCEVKMSSKYGTDLEVGDRLKIRL